MSAPETTPAVAPVEAPVAEVEPAAAPVTETEAPAAEAPAATEAAETTEAPAAEPTTETAAAEEAAAAEPAKAIESGVLGYKAPGLIKSFKFSKKEFWLGDEPVAIEKLSTYLRGEKPEVAHPTAAWSTQTGKGLIFFAKHGEDKAAPAGVLNLAEASDLEKGTPHEFIFKLHGQKHTFKAADDAERDGWYVAIEKAMTEAKASKDTIVTSEGYKEALAHVSKPAIVAGGAAPAVAAAPKSVEAPKTDDAVRTGSTSSSSEEEAKKKSKSRSVSRGKRASIFSNFLNKKEEHDSKKEAKKEETAEAKEETEEAKPQEAVEASEPVAAAAPLDAEEVAARAVDAPVEEAATEPAVATETAPATEAAKEEARPKPSKRSSIFGSFFEKVRSPGHEKKESDVGPVVPPKETVVSADPPFIPEPSTETQIESPAAPVEAPAPAVEEAAPVKPEVKAEPTSPQRKESFFGGMINKVRAKSPANVERATPKTEEAPAVPPKTEEVAAEPTVEEPAAEAAETTEAAPVEESTTEATKATTPKESRRKSYFGASGNKISNIFRKPSQAVRSTTGKKENVAPASEEKAVETPAVAEEATDAPVAEAPAVEATETKAEEPQSIGDVVPDAVNMGEEHKSSPAVTAAA